jgi:hypothetical protein
MALPNWLRLVFTYAPLVLSLNPKTAAIAGPVADGIAEAELIPGADGPTKKAAVLQIAADAVASLNDQTRVNLPPAETQAAVSSAIDTIVSVANLVQKHAEAVAPVAPAGPVSASGGGS